MSPWLWVAAGGAAVGVIALASRARASPAPPPASPPPPPPPPPPTSVPPSGFDPTKTYGETTRAALVVPTGWRRVTSAEVAALPELRTNASELRSSPGFINIPYGTLIPFVATDGKMYALWIEQHYHEPGGSIKPWGYHKGVTVLAKK